MRSKPPALLPSSSLAAPDSLEQLVGDCRRMAPHWRPPAATPRAAVSGTSLHGITVPPSSVRVVDAMPQYGG